jgi:hypothetical protein
VGLLYFYVDILCAACEEHHVLYGNGLIPKPFRLYAPTLPAFQLVISLTKIILNVLIYLDVSIIFA